MTPTRRAGWASPASRWAGRLTAAAALVTYLAIRTAQRAMHAHDVAEVREAQAVEALPDDAHSENPGVAQPDAR